MKVILKKIKHLCQQGRRSILWKIWLTQLLNEFQRGTLFITGIIYHVTMPRENRVKETNNAQLQKSGEGEGVQICIGGKIADVIYGRTLSRQSIMHSLTDFLDIIVNSFFHILYARPDHLLVAFSNTLQKYRIILLIVLSFRLWSLKPVHTSLEL